MHSKTGTITNISSTIMKPVNWYIMILSYLNTPYVRKICACVCEIVFDLWTEGRGESFDFNQKVENIFIKYIAIYYLLLNLPISCELPSDPIYNVVALENFNLACQYFINNHHLIRRRLVNENIFISGALNTI